jgi:hypothetical protein
MATYYTVDHRVVTKNEEKTRSIDMGRFLGKGSSGVFGGERSSAPNRSRTGGCSDPARATLCSFVGVADRITGRRLRPRPLLMLNGDGPTTCGSARRRPHDVDGIWRPIEDGRMGNLTKFCVVGSWDLASKSNHSEAI